MRCATRPLIWAALCGARVALSEESAAPAASSSREDRIRGALLGALVADALTLGSHYEYDAGNIRKAYGVAESDEPRHATFMYEGPGESMGGSTHGVGWGRRNYHPGQKKGDQTDFGEYSMLALEYLAQRGANAVNTPIELQDFLPFWKKRLSDRSWGAWKCTQTRRALEIYKEDVVLKGNKKQFDAHVKSLGGMSNAMSLRSPAVFGIYDDADAAAKASSALMFTHASSHALVGGEFFTRVAHKVVFNSKTPSSALREVCDEMAKGKFEAAFVKEQCDKGFAKFEEATGEASKSKKDSLANQPAAVVDDLAMTSMARLWDVGKSEPIKVGKASPTEGTMPSAIYIILKYEKQGLATAARANALVGGDNASRAVAIGMVLGAYYGADKGVPETLKTGLNNWKRAQTLLSRLPLLAGGGRGGAAGEL